MKRFIKALSLPALALLIYMMVQFVVGSVIAIITKMADTVVSVEMMSVILLVSSVITSVVLLTVKCFRLRNNFSSVGCSTSMLVVSVMAAIFGMFATDMMCEQFNPTNIFEDLFLEMSSNIYGVIAICLIGPITEEILFRGAIMSPMLHEGIHPWCVIIVSALIFGIIHLNPAQIPFAFVMGVIFGVIYYKTGSLVISSICHIINNSMSVYMLYKYGEKTKDIKWVDILGSTGAVYVTIVICTLLSVYMLVCFYKKQHECKFCIKEN